MKNQLVSIQEATDIINAGNFLAIAGAEAALDHLPTGNWIAGTTPYFITKENGGVVDEGKVFLTDISDIGSTSIATYSATELNQISSNCPDNGFAITIIPAASQAHQQFAADAANYEFAFLRPTVGWISGVHLSDIGKVTPKVYDGRTKTKYENRAVVIYVNPPLDKLPLVEIVNLFEQGNGDALQFTETSFQVNDVLVNGAPRNFAEYIREKGLEHGHLPLVGDFSGARINVSLQQVGQAGESVTLYAPVFTGVDYRFAQPVGDYASAFRNLLQQQEASDTVFSCNCILNFIFGDLEGKTIGEIDGPITFGEIAYQLLNQTLVTIRLS